MLFNVNPIYSYITDILVIKNHTRAIIIQLTVIYFRTGNYTQLQSTFFGDICFVTETMQRFKSNIFCFVCIKSLQENIKYYVALVFNQSFKKSKPFRFKNFESLVFNIFFSKTQNRLVFLRTLNRRLYNQNLTRKKRDQPTYKKQISGS